MMELGSEFLNILKDTVKLTDSVERLNTANIKLQNRVEGMNGRLIRLKTRLDTHVWIPMSKLLKNNKQLDLK